MSFQIHPLELPDCPDCEIVGFLCSSDDAADLGQDMVEVRLPTGVVINAGWYPESDPCGRYLVKVRGKKTMPSVEAADVGGAIKAIRRLVTEFTDERHESNTVGFPGESTDSQADPSPHTAQASKQD